MHLQDDSHCWCLARVLALLIIVALALGAFGCSHHEAPPPSPAPTTFPAPVVIYPPAPTTHQSIGRVVIYRLAKSKMDTRQEDENGLVPVSISVPVDSKAPAKDAIQHLVDADGSPMPDGAQLLSISIDDASGLARVNFSKEFVRNFKGGDREEAQIINSLRATLGQFSNIQNVQILVEGKRIQQLGGTLDLSESLPVIRLKGTHTVENTGI